MSETAQVFAFPARHDRLLTKREAARELTIGVRTLERLASQQTPVDVRVPSILVGGRRRFRWSVICRIKEEGTQSA